MSNVVSLEQYRSENRRTSEEAAAKASCEIEIITAWLQVGDRIRSAV